MQLKLFIIEYNAKFPPPAKISIREDNSTEWEHDDYMGASIQFISDILETKGYKYYIQQKVEYNTESDERIRAYILFPKNITKKAPVVYCHHQHSSNYEKGKSEIVPLTIFVKRLAEELVQIQSELIFSRINFDIGIGKWSNTSILRDKVKLKTNLFLFQE